LDLLCYMKGFFSILFVFSFSKSIAQDDTTFVRLVFDYLNTESFREEVTKFHVEQTDQWVMRLDLKGKDAKEFRERWENNSGSWASPKKCFYPDGFFIKADTSAGIRSKRDSLSFKKFNRTDQRINYQVKGRTASSEPLYLKVYLLRPGIIELRYFTGSHSLDKIRFGVDHILRIDVRNDKKIQPIQLGRILYN
jgi:hypothetical protein